MVVNYINSICMKHGTPSFTGQQPSKAIINSHVTRDDMPPTFTALSQNEYSTALFQRIATLHTEKVSNVLTYYMISGTATATSNSLTERPRES